MERNSVVNEKMVDSADTKEVLEVTSKISEDPKLSILGQIEADVVKGSQEIQAGISTGNENDVNNVSPAAEVDNTSETINEEDGEGKLSQNKVSDDDVPLPHSNSRLASTFVLQVGENEDDFLAEFISRSSISFDTSEKADEDRFLSNQDDETFRRLNEINQKVQEMLTKNDQEGISVDAISEEFSNLWEGIQMSHRNEVRLIQIDRNVSADLSATMAKSRYLIKIAEDDPILAQKLGRKLEDAWNSVDIGDAQEHSNESRIEQLRQDIFELNRNINSAASVEGHDTVKEFLEIKEDLNRQRNLAIAEANNLRTTLNRLFARRQEYFERRTNLEEKNRLLDDEFEAQKDAMIREASRKQRLTVDMEEIRTKMLNKMAEIDEVEKCLQNATLKYTETDKAVYEQRAVNEAALRDVEFSINRIEKLKSDFQNQQRLVERMTLDAYRRSQELRVKEDEVNNLKLELHRATRQRSLNVKKVVTLQHALATLEIERESLKTKICILEKDLESAQKKLEGNKRRVEELDKERSFVNRNLKRAVAVSTEHANQAKTHEVAVRTIEKAVKLYSEEIADQKHTVYRLEKERDFYSHEATKLAQQVGLRLSDIKKLDIAIFHYKKKLGVIETQVKKTQQIYELAVYDRSVFERTLRDTLAEIVENSTKLRHLTNEVATLKYQVNQKDEIIHIEALRYGRILKETEFFSKESQRIQRFAEDTQRQSQALQTERSRLGCFTAELQGELSKQNYYCTAAESTMGMYQRKLMEKEIELRQSWQKWKELHSMIRIGAYHYRNIMKEIKEARFHIFKARVQAGRLKTMMNQTRLWHEMAVIQNSISKEKCMINALKEQSRHPVNIHRWRVLEATSPEAYELIQRINLLTKRLVERNVYLKNQDEQLNEKQCMYVEVRTCIERSPGLEVPEEVKYCQSLISAKIKQLEVLKKDLNSAENQTSYYRDRVKELHIKMQELKHAYFARMDSKTICNADGLSASIRSQIESTDTCLTMMFIKLHSNSK
ncbi:unnamed protein product [Allacma fusca]|uniref:Cilia- and flagella-associated protein 58 central coiled coil domain-containing protein n=1 Tax=Allacma fusca TaxID=39272 RepID=A0A8J2KJQ2_9HEXA|nr:unnamed protein product [Allacma fusca]